MFFAICFTLSTPEQKAQIRGLQRNQNIDIIYNKGRARERLKNRLFLNLRDFPELPKENGQKGNFQSYRRKMDRKELPRVTEGNQATGMNLALALGVLLGISAQDRTGHCMAAPEGTAAGPGARECGTKAQFNPMNSGSTAGLRLMGR